MFTQFQNYALKNVGVTAQTLVTVPAANQYMVNQLSLSNTTNRDVTCSVTITRAGVVSFLARDAVVPQGGSLACAGRRQTIVLMAGDVVQVQSSTATSIDAMVSGLLNDFNPSATVPPPVLVLPPPSATIISSYVAGTSASAVQTRAGIPQSISFSGSQTTVLPAATNAAFATYPITVEAFVWTTANGVAIQLRNPTLNQATVLYNNFWSQTERTGNFTAGNSVPSALGEWRHIGFSLFSSTASTTVADRLLVFTNGSTVSSAQPFSLPIVGADNYQATGETVLQLGMWQFSAGSFGVPYTGFISDIRVSSGTRYGTTAGTYTIPSGAMTVDGTTLALIRAA
jgi:hypothetical protein